MLAEHRLNRQFCSQSFSRAHFSEDRRLLQPLSEQGSANTKNSTEQKCDAQPMRVISAGGSILVIPILTTEPSRIPAARPAVNVPQARLTRLEGKCSLTNTQAPGISPPIAAPCRTRRIRSAIGAITPMAL